MSFKNLVNSDFTETALKKASIKAKELEKDLDKLSRTLSKQYKVTSKKISKRYKKAETWELVTLVALLFSPLIILGIVILLNKKKKDKEFNDSQFTYENYATPSLSNKEDDEDSNDEPETINKSKEEENNDSNSEVNETTNSDLKDNSDNTKEKTTKGQKSNKKDKK